MARARRRRWQRMLPSSLVVIATVVAAAGCGATPGSPETVRTNVARETLGALNGAGWALDADHVGCHGPDTAGTVVCYGQTAEEPTADVNSTFAVRPGAHPPGRCPGELTVVVGTNTLTRLEQDPCQ